MPCGCSRAALRFVGVTANITDCRSVEMGSTPIRTANFMKAMRLGVTATWPASSLSER